ncbi:MAG: AAA family ATPase [Candidatus Diapherotrites archaeon]
MPKNIFSRTSRERHIFRNEQYLAPEFLPEKLPHRDSEIDTMVYAFNPVLRGSKPQNLFVFGPPGTGKTASVKFVLAQLEEHSDRAKMLYINCFQHESRHSVLAKLTNFLGMPVPRRGLATDETYSKMVEAMRKASFAPIIILDEVDNIAGAEEQSRLLYDLLRVAEQEKKQLGLVLVSNDAAFTARLDARVKSSLAAENLAFEPYSPQQLKDILRERAGYAFEQRVLEDDVINVAAAHAAKLGGDARIAIECLLKAGRNAERDNAASVTIAHLKRAFESIDSLPTLKKIRGLNENEKNLLRVIVQAQEESILSGDLYKKYNSSVPKGSKALTERRVRDFLNNLEKQGLVEISAVDLGNKGKTRSIRLRVAKQLALRELGN